MKNQKSKTKLNYDRLDNDYISEAYNDLAIAEAGRSFKVCCGILYGDTGFFKAGRLNIDFADGGVGKTTFELQKVIKFATGQAWYDIIPNGLIPVIYINTEQSRDEVIHRYLSQWLKENKDKPAFKRYAQNCKVITKSELNLNGGSKDIKQLEIKSKLKDIIATFRSKRNIPQSKLIMLIIDPAYSRWSDCFGNNKLIEQYITTPLLELSVALNVSINLVCHTHRKPPSKPLHQNYLQGGHTLFNAADSVFGFDCVSNDSPERTIKCFKGEDTTYSKITFKENSFFSKYEVGSSKYDCAKLRTLEPSSSTQLYKIISEIFPDVNSNNIKNIIFDLVHKKVLKKEKGKNRYVGIAYGLNQIDIDNVSTEELVDYLTNNE